MRSTAASHLPQLSWRVPHGTLSVIACNGYYTLSACRLSSRFPRETPELSLSICVSHAVGIARVLTCIFVYNMVSYFD